MWTTPPGLPETFPGVTLVVTSTDATQLDISPRNEKGYQSEDKSIAANPLSPKLPQMAYNSEEEVFVSTHYKASFSITIETTCRI